MLKSNSTALPSQLTVNLRQGHWLRVKGSEMEQVPDLSVRTPIVHHSTQHREKRITTEYVDCNSVSRRFYQVSHMQWFTRYYSLGEMVQCFLFTFLLSFQWWWGRR